MYTGAVIYLLVMSALFGIVIGSFLNVVIYRVPAGRTVVKGHSMCMTCGHNLAAKDLIPIISWATLKGKCRYCGAPIASRYTKIESFTGVAFLISAICAYKTAAPALVIFDYPEYTFGLVYFVLYALSVAAAISAMMIYFDTGKGYPGVAVWTLVLKIPAVLLPYMFNIIGDRGGVLNALKSVGIYLLQTGCAILLIFLLFLIGRKKYGIGDLFLDISILSLPLFNLYYYFRNQWIEFMAFALCYGILRTVTKGTSKDKYSGIIAVCTLLFISLIHYIYRMFITA